MTIILDDAGVGDLLFGVVIGAYRNEKQEFSYDIVDVKYFQNQKFRLKEYLKETSKIVFKLLRRLQVEEKEKIYICKGYIFDEAVRDLKERYGDNRIYRVKVVGKPQCLTETAYLNEIRNLGYKPIEQREERRAKSFFHMMNWLKRNPDKLRYAKTGWPRLSRYSLFKLYHQT